MSVDVAALVDKDRGMISRRIFWDEEIYQLELDRVFMRCWLLLGHESQVAEPGQYFTTWMGDEPIIVTRDREHQVRALINSCRHRGNSVCRADAGQTRSFLCAYHGWTYGLDGSLIGVPGDEERYHGDLDRGEWGLIPVPQVATYKGLIFGTFDPSAPSLEEYLGQTRWAVGCINSLCSAVASGGKGLVLMDEPSQPIVTDDVIDPTRWPGGLSTRERCP